MTLQEIANRMHEHAAKIFNGGTRKTGLMPMVHAEDDRGQVYVIGLPWGSPDEKQKQLAKVRSVLKRINAVRYAIVSEAWAATYDHSNAPHTEVRPSEREDRVEIVSIVAADRDGNTHAVAYMIERDAKGKPSIGAEFGHSDPDGLGTVTTHGQMLELLEDDHDRG